jgi:AmmeMemoRadiSam system protein A
MKYSETEKQSMLKLAHDAIAHGLEHNQMMQIDLAAYPQNLQKKQPCFVTLHLKDQLRGCIGSSHAHQPLANDIVHNAHAAAFGDPRFFPLTPEEFKNIDIHISVLNEPEPLQFDSEEDLIHKLRPNIDGLILTENNHRGTFLPSVWESLPDPKQFWKHLKLKAGLPEDYWSNTLKIERYTVESIG